ncbi:MAG: hypothetical protein FWH49_08565, partial [Clostridiales bacterium]|nr:hypothetical protein [Clostridiales bacterium]
MLCGSMKATLNEEDAHALMRDTFRLPQRLAPFPLLGQAANLVKRVLQRGLPLPGNHGGPGIWGILGNQGIAGNRRILGNRGAL